MNSRPPRRDDLVCRECGTVFAAEPTSKQAPGDVRRWTYHTTCRACRNAARFATADAVRVMDPGPLLPPVDPPEWMRRLAAAFEEKLRRGRFVDSGGCVRCGTASAGAQYRLGLCRACIGIGGAA